MKFKTKFSLLFLVAAQFLVGLLTNCTKNANDPKPVQQAWLIDTVYNNITVPTTWLSGHIYYIINDITVTNTLTIQPDVVVKFRTNKALAFITDGILNAQGRYDAAADSTHFVVFTSQKDDSRGGDSNADGISTTAAPGDWANVYLNTGAGGHVLKYCLFQFAGGNSRGTALELATSSSANISFCRFGHNKDNLRLNWGAALSCANGLNDVSVTHCTFYANQRPLSLPGNASLDSSNTFHKAGEAANSHNGIFMASGNNVNSPQTLLETEVPYVMLFYWQIKDGSLEIGPNVVLKFKQGIEFSFFGISRITGYNRPGVQFTSYLDDTIGGDTNGDGSVSNPAANDWVGIRDINNQTVNRGYQTWTNMYYNQY